MKRAIAGKTMKIGVSVAACLMLLVCAVVAPVYARAAESFDYSQYADTYEPDTGIVAPPTVAFNVDSAFDLSALSDEKPPAVAVFTVNADGKVVGSGGGVIASADEALRACNHRIIPAFRFSDEASMRATLDYVKSVNAVDVMIMSDNARLIKDFKAEYPYVQGCVMFSDADMSDYSEIVSIRNTVNSANGLIAVVEGNIVKEGVETLQALGITCWSVVQNTQYGIYDALYNGVNGMIVDSFSLPIDIMERVYDTTMIRRVFLSGHRGESSMPENTVAGARAAYRYGADYVELDIVRSKDDNLVVMHDDTLKRTTTCDEDLAIGDMTLDEIRRYKVKKGSIEEEIPILEDYLDLVKELDGLRLLIELKTNDFEVVPLLVKKLKDSKADDKVIVISFHENMLEDFHAQMPEVSVNFLVDNNHAAYEDVGNLCYYAYTQNSSYGPGYTSLMSTDVLRLARVRGIPVYSWTYGAVTVFEKYMLDNNTSLTSDISSYAKDQIISLSADTEQSYTPTEPTAKTVAASYSVRERQEDRRISVPADSLTLQKGASLPSLGSRSLAEVADFSDSTLTLGTGEGCGVYWFTAQWKSVASKNKYQVMSRPFEVVSGVDPAAYREALTEESYLGVSDKPNKKCGCGANVFGDFAAAGIPLAVVAIAAFATAASLRFRRNKS